MLCKRKETQCLFHSVWYLVINDTDETLGLCWCSSLFNNCSQMGRCVSSRIWKVKYKIKQNVVDHFSRVSKASIHRTQINFLKGGVPQGSTFVNEANWMNCKHITEFNLVFLNIFLVFQYLIWLFLCTLKVGKSMVSCARFRLHARHWSGL